MPVSIGNALEETTIGFDEAGEFVTGTLEETDIFGYTPFTEETLRQKLAQASQDLGWGEVRGLAEKDLFLYQYRQIKQEVVREAGLTALQWYDTYQPLVEAATLLLGSEDKAGEDFLGTEATSDQLFIRQINTDTFDMATGDKIFSTGGTGTFYAVPRAAVGGPDPGAYTLPTDDQMLVIFYYMNTLNTKVFERLQEKLNDDIGTRRAFEVYNGLNRSNQGLIPRAGALVVEDGRDYQLVAEVVANSDIDLLPQGVEILKTSVATSLL